MEMPETRKGKSLLDGTRVYLSGPMDFVASRADEKKYGWRNRIGQYLQHHGATVFDPWNKPLVRGLQGYGVEDETSVKARELWTFEAGEKGARARAECARGFWETVHIDLRMVDVSDLVIAYVPTNVYSVGTPHEIVLARQQHKPVLFVSPPVRHEAHQELREHLAGDRDGLALLDRLASELPIVENPQGIPSLWYMPIVGTEHFFDGFGFGLPELQSSCDWAGDAELDDNERRAEFKRPLLPFLQSLVTGKAPQRWDDRLENWVEDDEWLILDQCLRTSRAQS